MIRTILAVIACTAAVLWLPVWVQIGVFVAVVFFARYRLALLIPAVYADVLYAPTHSFKYFTMTFITLAMLIAWFLISTKTRMGEAYDPIRK